MSQIINLTPHSITVGSTVVEPSGSIARVATIESLTSSTVLGVPVIKRELGKVDFGIDFAPDTVYIVSSMVLDAIPASSQWASVCYAPDTGSTAIRNDKGHVVSVTRLVGR